jgi:hypothetical protein
MLLDIVPHKAPNATHSDQQDQDQIHAPMLHITGQRRKRHLKAHQIKTGVAKARYGMEQRVPRAFQHAIFRCKKGEKQQCAHKLDQERRIHYEFGEPHDPTYLGRGDCFLHGASLLQADFLPGQKGKGNGGGDYAQAADLNHKKNDCLA